MSCRRRVLIRMETRGTTAQERRTPTSAHGPSAVGPSRWGRLPGKSRGTGRITISTITPDTRIPADRKAAPTERIIRDRIRASVVVIKSPLLRRRAFIHYEIKIPPSRSIRDSHLSQDEGVIERGFFQAVVAAARASMAGGA